MSFGDDVVCEGESQSDSFAGRFGGEEGLEDFLLDGLGDTSAVVFYVDFYGVLGLEGGGGDEWLVIGARAGSPSNGVESVVEEV